VLRFSTVDKQSTGGASGTQRTRPGNAFPGLRSHARQSVGLVSIDPQTHALASVATRRPSPRSGERGYAQTFRQRTKKSSCVVVRQDRRPKKGLWTSDATRLPQPRGSSASVPSVAAELLRSPLNRTTTHRTTPIHPAGDAFDPETLFKVSLRATRPAGGNADRVDYGESSTVDDVSDRKTPTGRDRRLLFTSRWSFPVRTSLRPSSPT